MAEEGECTPKQSPRSRKRIRGTPTFETPHRPRKSQRVPLKEQGNGQAYRRCLFVQDKGEKSEPWSEDELKALVEFVLFNSESWPTHKQYEFWNKAADFVRNRASTGHTRSGKYCSCRDSSFLPWLYN